MKIAYLITAYNNPTHLGRLLDAILTPQSAAFVHVDGKFDVAPFRQLQRTNVYFCDPRVKVYWGEFTMVEAILRLIQDAMDSPMQFDRLALISGSDYPIRPIAAFEAHLAANHDKEFMNIVAMPNELVHKPISRLQDYFVQSGRPFTAPLKVARWILKNARLLPRQRNFDAGLQGLKPYGGSTWWVLSRAACQYVLDFVAREQRIVNFYRNVWFPDEGMLHTIIGNSSFASRVARNFTYTDWRAGGSHPRPIAEEHVQRFMHEKQLVSDDSYGPGELFFARKFNDGDGALIARLNAFFATQPPTRSHTVINERVTAAFTPSTAT